jgi:hypothetical protein
VTVIYKYICNPKLFILSFLRLAVAPGLNVEHSFIYAYHISRPRGKTNRKSGRIEKKIEILNGDAKSAPLHMRLALHAQ